MELVTPNRTYYFCAENPADVASWVSAFVTTSSNLIESLMDGTAQLSNPMVCLLFLFFFSFDQEHKNGTLSEKTKQNTKQRDG